MLKSFSQYVNENYDFSRDSILKCAEDLMNSIKSINDTGDNYIEKRGLEYRGDTTFDLVLQLKKDSNPNIESDSHFNELPWEEVNFKNKGYAIDANTRVDKGDLLIPEIIVTLILDPSREPESHQDLRLRLIDILAHEINHLNQVGWNREPFNVRPSSNKRRSESQEAASYFLLPDEIESMVAGMYTRSKEENIEIDKVFDEYLAPYLQEGKLNKEEYLEALRAWVHHALENYPDVKLSMDDPKIQQIVHSI